MNRCNFLFLCHKWGCLFSHCSMVAEMLRGMCFCSIFSNVLYPMQSNKLDHWTALGTFTLQQQSERGSMPCILFLPLSVFTQQWTIWSTIFSLISASSPPLPTLSIDHYHVSGLCYSLVAVAFHSLSCLSLYLFFVCQTWSWQQALI